MYQVWKKTLACFLMAALLLGVMALQGESALAVSYGKTTATGVRLRKAPSTGAEIWFRLPIDYVCAYSETTTDASGVTWYKVNVSNPETTSSATYVGYLHGSYFRPLTDAEASAYASSGTVASSDTTGVSIASATGVVTNGEVNVRQQPSLQSPSMFKLDRGTVVELLSIPADSDLDPWYCVKYNGFTGYIQGPFIRVTSYGSLTKPTATPAPNGGTSSSAGSTGGTGEATYVTLILSSCHLRSAPGGTVYEEWEERGSSLPVAGAAVMQGGYTWYPVQYKNRIVYVRGDCVSVTYANGSSSGTVATAVPTVDQNTVAGYLVTTKSNVNLRLQPAGTVIRQVPKDLQLAYYGTPQSVSGYTWYYVTVDSVRGYLRSDCVRVVSGAEVITQVPATATQETAVTEAAEAITQAPEATQAPAGSLGYVKTIVGKVNLRATPGGATQEQIALHVVLPLIGTPVVSGRYTWYPVRAESGRTGYLRNDCVQLCDASGNTSPAATAVTATEAPSAVTAAPSTSGSTATSGTVQTTLDKVALRTAASPDAKVADRVSVGTSMIFSNVTIGGGYTWYQVNYAGKTYYVRGDCVRVTATTASSETAAAAETAGTATAEPVSATILGYVKTIKGGVNVRTEPAGKEILGRVERNLTFPYYAKTSASGYSWYRVNSTYGTGYLRSDCVVEVNASGAEIPANTATNASSTNVSQDQVEATYATLKVGSSGTGVRNLVTELINQGYYKGTVTSEYTTAVANAVKAFQAAHGLTADGVANETTQHRLFGTSSVGTLDYSNLSMVIYPAEKIDWFTGGIQDLIPKGSNFKVYDVKTGIVWWAHRWSGGNHADIETLTAADTARLCRIYGVSKASEIKESTHWQRRPCLITVGTRTFACALYGVPHNSDGDTIADNALDGQICLHFTNSRTHGSNKVVSYNEEAIEYAWQYAPNGHK